MQENVEAMGTSAGQEADGFYLFIVSKKKNIKKTLNYQTLRRQCRARHPWQ